MFYYRPAYILYRDYPDFGYLTDNRNFGYDTACKSCVKVGDRILSKTGSVFYSVLTEKPQSEEDIVQQLAHLFIGATYAEIRADSGEFFQELARDGFVGCGLREKRRSVYFSYDDKQSKSLSENALEGTVEEHDFFTKWGQDYHLSRVHLEVSALCNERCVHCYFPESYRKKIMSRDLFLKILEQCKECNVLSITISGGEPMLNPNLLFFIRECRQNNFSINLLSNLTLLSEEMLREFDRTPLLSVQTSLYSMNPDVHDSITSVKGSFEKTKRAIETLHQHNIPMQINCPIMKQNKDTYQGVLDWAKALNIEGDSDYMLFGCFDRSGNNLKCRLELSELDPFINRGFDPDHGRRKDNSGLGWSDYTICPVCISSVCISHNGKVYPCEGWQNHSLGSIKDDSLKRIWEESSGIQELRSLSYDDFPVCRVCEDREFCSICLIRNANESAAGDYRQINPYYCEIARIKRLYAEKKAYLKRSPTMLH